MPTGCASLLVDYDGSGKASGIKFYVSGKQVETEILKDHLTRQLSTPRPRWRLATRPWEHLSKAPWTTCEFTIAC